MNTTAVPVGGAPTPELIRTYVWEWPVRLAHWLVVFSLGVLAFTGIYMGHPFLVSPGPSEQRFVMGTVKVVHFYAAIVFTLSVLARILWMFLGNEYASWKEFIPLRRQRRRGMLSTLKFYLFLRRDPPTFIGHNPLAGATYTLVFLLYSADDRDRICALLRQRTGGLSHARLSTLCCRSSVGRRRRAGSITSACGCCSGLPYTMSTAPS